MMKKLVALLMALALLCSSIGAFAEPTGEPTGEPTANPTQTAESGREGEDQYGYISVETADEYKKHVGHDVQKSGVAGPEADVAPTCTTDGRTWSICKNEDCKVRFWQPVEKLGHNTEGVEWTVLKAATALENGRQVKYCTVCNEEAEEEVLTHLFDITKANPDDYDLTKTVVIPQGVGNEDQLHKNGYALKTNPDPLVISCKKQTLGFFCIDCQTVVTVEVSNNNHQKFDEPNKTKVETIDEGSCTTPAVYRYTGCKVCGADTVWTVSIAPEGHKYDENSPIKVVEPTCTAPGYKLYKCTVCGKDVKVDGKDAEGHKWSDVPVEYVITPATCKVEGRYSKAIVCNVCGAVKPGSEDNDLVDTIEPYDHQELLDALAEAEKYYFFDEDDEKFYVTDWFEGLFADGETEVLQAEEDMAVEIDENKQILCEYGQLKYSYKPATCTTEGHVSVVCLECGANIEMDLDALGHAIKQPTIDDPKLMFEDYDCTKTYNILVECERPGCDYTYNMTYPSRVAHEYKYNIIVGYAQELPNHSIVRYYNDDLEQLIEDGKIHPCWGYYEIVECDNCFVNKLVAVEGTGEHKIDLAENHTEKKATCTEDGYYAYQCEYCHMGISGVESATGHTMVNGKAIDNATCKKEGKRQIYCKDCAVFDKKTGALLQSVAEEKGIQTKPIPTIDHNWVHVEIPADCIHGKEGAEYDICSMCQTKKNEVITSGHQPIMATAVVTKDPTCTADGTWDFTCALCHVRYTKQKLPALGHSYQRKYDEQGKQIGVTSIEDYEKAHVNAKGAMCSEDCVPAKCLTDAKHVVTCTVCKEDLVWTEKDTAIGHHNWLEKDDSLTKTFTVVKVPSCEVDGYALYNCTVCGSQERYELAKLPHNMVATYDYNKNCFFFECTPIYNIEVPDLAHGKEYPLGCLRRMLIEAYDYWEIAELVEEKMLIDVADGAKIGSFGNSGHVVEIPAMKTEFAISKNESGRGVITLKDENMVFDFDAYVRITWCYTLNNGDTVSFTACRDTEWIDGERTFKLGGLRVPSDAILDDIWVEVVNDPDADEKFVGQYNTFGAGSVK